METLQQLLTSIAGGLIVAVLLALSPLIPLDILERSIVYLDVYKEKEQLGKIQIITINSENNGTIDSLQFYPNFSPAPLLILINTIESGRISESYARQTSLSDSHWEWEKSQNLESGIKIEGGAKIEEGIRVRLVSNESIDMPNEKDLFSGTYSWLDDDGSIQSSPVIVRNDAEVKADIYDSVSDVLKTLGPGVFIFFLVSFLGISITKKRRAKTSDRGAPVESTQSTLLTS